MTDAAWSIDAELRFVSGLGTHSDYLTRFRWKSRRDLLTGYAKALELRGGFTDYELRMLRQRIDVELCQEPQAKEG